jgi:threonine dehydratase
MVGIFQGERVGNVLVGLQIPPAEEAQFRSAADALGYQYVSEGNNEAFRMFLR